MLVPRPKQWSSTRNRASNVGSETEAVVLDTKSSIKCWFRDRSSGARRQIFHQMLVPRPKQWCSTVNLPSNVGSEIEAVVLDAESCIKCWFRDRSSGARHQIFHQMLVPRPKQWCSTVNLLSNVGSETEEVALDAE